jgi:hypothetical protein
MVTKIQIAIDVSDRNSANYGLLRNADVDVVLADQPKDWWRFDRFVREFARGY